MSLSDYSHILSIDLETYCEFDIKTVGGYKYAENSEILLFAYAFDENPVQCIDVINGEEIPYEIIQALTDPKIIKTAYNAQFERTVLSHWLYQRGYIDTFRWLDPSQWFCTMVQGYTLGLPGGLDNIGKVLKLAEDKQKLAIGKRLIQYFCKPCKPTKVNGGRTRNLPEHDNEKWMLFKEYCIRDVESERAIRQKIEWAYPIDRERKLWALDQKINDRGVLVDKDLAHNAVDIDTRIKSEATQEAIWLTGIANPNSNQQIINWIEEETGQRIKSFDKSARAELYENTSSDNLKRFIELKNLLSKTSVKKYMAMLNTTCEDGRCHGMLQFYGASRTGRWAGRNLQIHNLPQNHLKDLAEARDILKHNDYEALCMFYNNPSDILSQLVRTAFIAKKGCRYIVADFSAIEARVIAWIANEKWRQEVFKNGGDIYCESASQMFHVPVVKHGVNGELRQKGKVAELACGYGGGVNALKAFGADKLGMSEAEMQHTIDRWRKSSPNIVKLWSDLERGAKKAITLKDTPVKYKKNIVFYRKKGILFLKLPSGRSIAYVKPKIEMEDGFGRETITYEGTIQGNGGWGRIHTWGGVLTENLVQATARDCLGVAMLRLEKAGYKIVMHVHDEVILEMPYGVGSLEEATKFMGEPIPWAPGLILTADGYETEYYKKD